jgi:hypothetical protein
VRSPDARSARRTRRAPLWLALLVAGCVTVPADAPPEKKDASEARALENAQPIVLLVSIGGFTPAALEVRPEGPPLLPTVAAFAQEGVLAEHVEPVTPAAVHPAHASLVTGVVPARHGIVADRRIGERGVSGVTYSAANALKIRPLWQRVGETGQLVASLDWPTTQGAAIPLLLPDVGVPAAGQSWLDLLREGSSSALAAMAERAGAAAPDTALPGAARDAVLVGVACELVAAPRPPLLLQLRLSQTTMALALSGPSSAQALQAFAGADKELSRLLHCLRDAGHLETSSVFVVGDFGFTPVHGAIAANAALAEARLLTTQGSAVSGWEAIARSNGGSAFVYARAERAAVRARDVLQTEAQASGVFRVLSADEMLRAGADPDAWFGLEALPGYVFEDAASGPVLRAAALRGAGGYVSDVPAQQPGFAAWGRGIRRGIRIPSMRQTDVAPTLASLLAVSLDDRDGRVLVGVFEPPVGTGVAAEGR